MTIEPVAVWGAAGILILLLIGFFISHRRASNALVNLAETVEAFRASDPDGFTEWRKEWTRRHINGIRHSAWMTEAEITSGPGPTRTVGFSMNEHGG